MKTISVAEQDVKTFYEKGLNSLGPLLSRLEDTLTRLCAPNQRKELSSLGQHFVGGYYALQCRLTSGVPKPVTPIPLISLYGASTATLERGEFERVVMNNGKLRPISLSFSNEYDPIRAGIEHIVETLLASRGSPAYAFLHSLLDLQDAAFQSMKRSSGERFFQEYHIQFNGYDLKQITRLADRIPKPNAVVRSVQRPGEQESGIKGESEVDSIRSVTKKLQEAQFVFEEVNPADVVGETNRATKEALMDAVYGLMLYDTEKKANPALHEFKDGTWVKRELPFFRDRFLLYGPGGLGKTYQAKAAMTFGRRLSKQYQRDMDVLDPSKVYNSYKHGTLQAVNTLLEEIDRGENRFILFLDEIDMLISPRNSRDNDSEDRELLGLYMRWLGGGSRGLGNCLVFATTNKMSGLDEYFLQRFQKGVFEIKPPANPDEFVQLFQVKFRRSIKEGLIQVEHWQSLGQLCMDYHATPRDIEFVCDQLGNVVRGKMPSNLLGKSTEEQAAIFSQSLKPLQEPQVTSLFLDYFKKKGESINYRDRSIGG